MLASFPSYNECIIFGKLCKEIIANFSWLISVQVISQMWYFMNYDW